MNKELRLEILDFKKEKGITYKFIYTQLGWNKSTFHNWMYGQYDLSSEKIMELSSFIKQYK